MSGRAYGAKALTSRDVGAMKTAIATVQQDPARPVTKAGCWERVGNLLGISAGAAQTRAHKWGLTITAGHRDRCPHCGALAATQHPTRIAVQPGELDRH